MNMATKTSIVLPKSVTLTAEQAGALLKSGIQTTITVTTTKEFIEWALAHNSHNRPLSPRTVELYADMLEKDRWFLTNQGIGFTNTGFLADGQHRLEAMKKAGYPHVQINVTFGMENDAQLIVDRQRIRTAADGIALTTDMRLTKRHGGVIPWLWSLDNGTHSTRGLDPFIYRATAEKYYDALIAVVSGENAKGLSSAFFAPLVYLYAHGEKLETVKDFILGVSTGIGLAKGDPRLKYRNFYMSGPSSTSGVARTGMFVASAQLFIAYAEEKPVMVFIPYTMEKAFATLRARARVLTNQPKGTEP